MVSHIPYVYIYIDHEQCKFGRVCYAMRHEDAWVVMDCRLGHLEPPRLPATSSCTSPAAVWQKLSATDPKSSGRKVRPTKHTSYLQATCRKLMETDHDMVGMEGSYFWNLIVVKRPHTLWSMEPFAKAYYLDAIVMRHISLNQAPAVGMQKKELGAWFATGNTFQTFLEPFNLALVIGLIGWPSCLRLRPVSTIRPEEATVEHRQRVGKWNSMKFRKPPVSKLLWKGSAFAVPLCKKAGEVCGKA